MKRAVLASLILTLGLVSPTFAQNQRWNELANLPFQQGYPSDEMKQQLMDELLFERGVQSYLWSLPAINLPAINMWAMKEGSEALQVLRRNADAPPGARCERMDAPSPQKLPRQPTPNQIRLLQQNRPKAANPHRRECFHNAGCLRWRSRRTLP